MRKLIYLLLLVVLIIVIYFLVSEKNRNVHTLDREQTLIEVQEDIQNIKMQEEAILKWVPDADIGHIEGENDSNYNSHEGLVKYLYAALVLEDVNMFLENFDPEILSSALFTIDNPNKEEVVLSWIHEMTREGKLENLAYKNKKGVFDTEVNELDIHFIYSDGITVIIPVTLKNMVHHHDDDIESIVVIQTPIETILEEIKKH